MSGHLNVGFSPLNDMALLAVAEAGGFFASEGLDVRLHQEVSWSNIRDKLSYGLFDAAHCLAPVPFGHALGLGPKMGELMVPMALSVNGNALVVSAKLWADLKADATETPDLKALSRHLRDQMNYRRRHGKPRLIIGIPYLLSCHSLVLRHWIMAGGADPETQVQWMVLPPSKMVGMLKSGLLDGFMAGAPWPQLAAIEGAGHILFDDEAYWSLKPEKVLAVRKEWGDKNPDALRGLIRALLRAALWACEGSNYADLISLLAQPNYVNAPKAAIAAALSPERTAV